MYQHLNGGSIDKLKGDILSVTSYLDRISQWNILQILAKLKTITTTTTTTTTTLTTTTNQTSKQLKNTFTANAEKNSIRMHMFYIDYIPCVDCTCVVIRAWIESAKPRNGLWPSWYVAWIKISMADPSSYHIDKQTVGESALPVLLYINPKLILFSESITFEI